MNKIEAFCNIITNIEAEKNKIAIMVDKQNYDLPTIEKKLLKQYDKMLTECYAKLSNMIDDEKDNTV